MTLTVITPPAEPAVSLADAKAYLRIGHAGEDALLAELVAAATTRLEAASGLTLVRRTLSRRLYAWPATLAGNGFILRPRPVTRFSPAGWSCAPGAWHRRSARAAMPRLSSSAAMARQPTCRTTSSWR